jgi:hypothetical protein
MYGVPSHKASELLLGITLELLDVSLDEEGSTELLLGCSTLELDGIALELLGCSLDDELSAMEELDISSTELLLSAEEDDENPASKIDEELDTSSSPINLGNSGREVSVQDKRKIAANPKIAFIFFLCLKGENLEYRVWIKCAELF